MHSAKKLPSKVTEELRLLLWSCGAVELLGMSDKWLLQQKRYYKCVHDDTLLKTPHCAHIPLDDVPKGAQPLAQPESEKRQRQFDEKDKGLG